ncbi:MAG: hypothetical protein HRU75_14325 [Planctomycetia bacterium]|nr:MAG: hypothetical protein HRU75_14325 [Planctomycetia bacterium]
MSDAARVVIAKDGGAAERFSEAKLRRCLRIGLSEGGCEVELAGPLARAVGMHLAEQLDPCTLSTGYLFECVTAVLRRTNLEGAADALEAHRRRRSDSRNRLRVFDPARVKRGAVPWRKSAIVGLLENRFGVRHAVARGLAGEVESRVFGLGFRVVRLPLVIEVIENELMSWGLRGASGDDVEAVLWSKPVGSRWPAREE